MFLDYVEAHPLQSLLCQIALLSVIAASAGTLIGHFVPYAVDSGVGKGIYVAGVVVILFFETVYQWLLRAATLPIEEGAVSLLTVRSPSTPSDKLRSALGSVREANEARLARLFEPLLRVGLIALALSVHFVAQTYGKLSQPPVWAETLTQDWAMTLMFGVAGLLWQLKNPDNIGKLLLHLKLQIKATEARRCFR